MQIVNIITQYYPSFFKALGITLQMTVISLLCATVLGVFSACSRSRILRY